MKPDGLASACGLSPDTLVVAGGADTQHSLLGCGVLEVTHACIVAGTTSPIQMVVDRPLVDPPRQHLDELPRQAWHVGAGEQRRPHGVRVLVVCGSPARVLPVHRCRRDLQAPRRGGGNFLRRGAGGLVFALDPHVMGDSAAAGDYRGLIHGIRTSGAGRTGAAEFARALMENMASAYALNVQQLQRVWGGPIASITVSGEAPRAALS